MDNYKLPHNQNSNKDYDCFPQEKDNSTNNYIKNSLENLVVEDEMAILTSLNELCTVLSMANDNIADDSNCVLLIKELIVLLDKYYMIPDIGSNEIN